jgi:hypothetical protein
MNGSTADNQRHLAGGVVLGAAAEEPDHRHPARSQRARLVRADGRRRPHRLARAQVTHLPPHSLSSLPRRADTGADSRAAWSASRCKWMRGPAAGTCNDTELKKCNAIAFLHRNAIRNAEWMRGVGGLPRAETFAGSASAMMLIHDCAEVSQSSPNCFDLVRRRRRQRRRGQQRRRGRQRRRAAAAAAAW